MTASRALWVTVLLLTALVTDPGLAGLAVIALLIGWESLP